MAGYKCLLCDKKVSQQVMGRRVRCPYCGSKMLFKPRATATKLLAR